MAAAITVASTVRNAMRLKESVCVTIAVGTVPAAVGDHPQAEHRQQRGE